MVSFFIIIHWIQEDLDSCSFCTSCRKSLVSGLHTEDDTMNSNENFWPNSNHNEQQKLQKKLNMCFSNISSYDCFWHNISAESKTSVTNSQKLGSGEVSHRLQRPDQISNKTNSNENFCQLILITMSNRNCTWKLFVWTHVICSSFLHNIRVWLKCDTNSQKLGSGEVSQRLQRPDQISKKTNSNENFCQLIGLITMGKQKIAPENYVFELMLYAGFWHNISVWLKWHTNSQKLAGSAEVQSAAKNWSDSPRRKCFWMYNITADPGWSPRRNLVNFLM
jgi:hypothetical protein